MNEEEYSQWKERIRLLLKSDNETEDFIDYLINWFNNIQGRTECELLQTYHPDFSNSSEEEVFDFIRKVRALPNFLSEKDYKRQMFDSAFFLYRPYIKEEFKNSLS